MERIFTYILLFTLILNSHAQEWNVLNEGMRRSLIIDFISDDVGWIAEDWGSIRKTEDGGETWNTIFEGDDDPHDMKFINELTGWMIYECMILKTSDGGYSWEIQEEWVDCIPYEIFVVNDTVVYLYGSNFIYKTIDGGDTWLDISPDYSGFSSLWFFNPEFGIVTGHSRSPDSSYILKTFDGGNTWERIIIPEFVNIYNLQFSNDSTGYFLAYSDTLDYFCTTTDTLRTWTSNSHAPSIKSYSIPDEKTIVAITGSFRGNDAAIIISRDGGQIWGEKQSLYVCSPDKIQFSSSRVGYLIGRQGSSSTGAWKTIDGGNSWENKIFSYPFTDVYFINNNRGIATGGWEISRGHFYSDHYGNILMTYYGGLTWENKLSAKQFIKLNFLNDKVGFAIGSAYGRVYYTAAFFVSNSVIYKTTDSGENWTNIFRNNPDSMGYIFEAADLCFITEQTGFVVGEYYSENSSGAAIIGSDNSGENWDHVWKYPQPEDYEYRLNSVTKTDSTVWAVGESGMIIKYTEQQHWQLQSFITDLPLNDVFFSDEQHGWIAGGYLYLGSIKKLLKKVVVHIQSILLKTKNAGQTWKEIRFDKYFVNDMYFADSLHGWATGADTTGSGMILETFDGGDNWNVIIEHLSAPLNTIHFKDGIGWAMGDNGLVLRTDNWTTWIDQTKGEKYPANYNLSQNYPNPFNPVTMINYQLPMTSTVELSIYNLLGQRVATLINERKRAGHYQVEWDASGHSSGIYYYQLKAGEFQDVKKMILIK